MCDSTAVTLVLKGKPIPYVRMTRRSKYVNARAKAYLASKEDLGWQMRQEMGSRPPFGREPLVVRILVSCRNGPDHHRDIDNILKALLDAANGIVYEDDRWVDVVSISREVGEEDRTLMIVERIEEE